MGIPEDAQRLGLQILASTNPSERAAALSSLVMDLLVEVQALRLAVAAVPEAREKYREAYESTYVLSHNSAGVTPGQVKVLKEFLTQREGAWLKRLGVSDAEVAAFESHCREVETYS